MRDLYFVLFFLVGLLWYAPIVFIGTFRIGELICMLTCISCFLAIVNFIRSNKTISNLFRFWALTFALIAISNIYNGTDSVGLMKGLANYVFILSTFLFFAFFLKQNIYLIVGFLIGQALGANFFSPYLLTNDIFGDNYFDIAIVPVLRPTLYVLCIFLSSIPSITIFLAIGVAILSIYNNASSTGGTILLGSILSYLKFFIRKLNMRTLGIILLIISSITLYITKFTLDSNEQLYNPWVTKSSSPLVVFLYSIHRIEPLIGLKAISDKPLIGHGSHTKTNFYTRWAIQQGIITKYQMTGEREEMIPVHSVVLTSMVEGGIFAGLLWIFIVFYLLKSIPNMLFRSPRKYAIVAVLMVMDSMWNIFFSPLGYARFDLPIIFGFIWALNTYHLRVKANPTPNFGQVAI